MITILDHPLRLVPKILGKKLKKELKNKFKISKLFLYIFKFVTF